MKTFLVTRPDPDGKKDAWLAFAESEEEVHKRNESGFPFQIVEIPLREWDSSFFASLLAVAHPNCDRKLGNLIRETAAAAARSGISLDRIWDFI